MQAVQEENRKKSEELESIRNHMQQVHSKPVPPPFPAELDRYSRQAEQTPENGVQTISSPVIHPRYATPCSPLSSPHSPESPLSPVSQMSSHPLSSLPPSSPHLSHPSTHPSHPSSPQRSLPPKIHPSILPTPSRSSPPVSTVQSPTKARSVPTLPPPKPASLLQEIRDPSNHVKLRKVPK